MTRPLHARIREDMEADILSGRLAPGDRLPVEHELMLRYGCARMTVSKALTSLADAGLIERRKRAGSFVARPRLHSMVLDVPDLAAEVAARGQRYGYRLLNRRRRLPRVAIPAEVALAARGELLEIECLHLADGVGLAVEHRLVSLAAVPAIVGADLSHTAPGSWLLAHVPWTEAETRIAAEGATGLTADRLGVAPGTACLVLERQTWREARRVTRSRQIFRGDAYDLVARFGATARPASATHPKDTSPSPAQS